MAFDNPEREKPEVCEYKAALERVLSEIGKLRADMTPLLEKHQREEERREAQEKLRQTMVGQELERLNQLAASYHAQPLGGRLHSDCDCSPSRTAALAGRFSDWLDRQIESKKN